MPPEWTGLLLALARSTGSADVRMEALSALPAGALVVDEPLFAALCQSLDSRAAGLLARAKLNDAQRAALAALLPKLGPLEMMRLLPAFDQALPEPLARQFLAGLAQAPALASCPPESLRQILAKQPASLKAEGDALLARFQQDTAQQRAKLDTIAAELPVGDVRRGQSVFAKTGCIVCHSMGYLGGKFGPDLTSIGNVRNERDLLEAIVFPSASFVRSYEPMMVKLKSGAALMGLIRSESSDSIVLATAPGAEMRIARNEVAEMQPGSTSLMPQGFDQVLSRQDLSDLITFLKGAPKKP